MFISRDSVNGLRNGFPLILSCTHPSACISSVAELSGAEKYSRQHGEHRRMVGAREGQTYERRGGGGVVASWRANFSLPSRHVTRPMQNPCEQFTSLIGRDKAWQDGCWRWSATGCWSWQWLTRARKNTDNAVWHSYTPFTSLLQVMCFLLKENTLSWSHFHHKNTRVSSFKSSVLICLLSGEMDHLQRKHSYINLSYVNFIEHNPTYTFQWDAGLR